MAAVEAANTERAMQRGEYDLVYVAPERLVTERFMDVLRRTQLALFAIDEAHCVSQWGHDFRPEYIQLNRLHEQFPAVPRLACTATADEPTRQEIIDKLRLGAAQVYVTSLTAKYSLHNRCQARSTAAVVALHQAAPCKLCRYCVLLYAPEQ
ncbi:ATP-dependent DNA helicase RecQ [Chloroflexota bacterium]|nr:ATP-dependent DNA helicase RecQ [Chloroflexota bacterium]